MVEYWLLTVLVGCSRGGWSGVVWCEAVAEECLLCPVLSSALLTSQLSLLLSWAGGAVVLKEDRGQEAFRRHQEWDTPSQQWECRRDTGCDHNPALQQSISKWVQSLHLSSTVLHYHPPSTSYLPYNHQGGQRSPPKMSVRVNWSFIL